LLDRSQCFHKYQWIETKVVRDVRDPRPENHKLAGKIRLLKQLGTHRQWEERKNIVLQNVYTNLTQLRQEARDPHISTSLAVFRPARLVSFQLKRTNSKQAYITRKRILPERLIPQDKLPYRYAASARIFAAISRSQRSPLASNLSLL
jgi:hypothetical protein